MLERELLALGGVSTPAFGRYAAPLIEETLKASCLLVFIVRRRVGFLVDAVVLGFAVGAGFALVENVQYLRSLPNASLLLWLVRGLGTAVLHGGTTSIFAMIAKTLFDRSDEHLWRAAIPGWVAAVVIHSIFNHDLLPALAETLVLLVALPLAMLWIFARSERATREWVVAGLDLDLELLQLIRSEQFAATRFGRYLRQLRDRLPGAVVLDMYCLLRLELEISIQAKGLLMAREAGIEVPADRDRHEILAEVRYLRRSIGKAGLLALRPLHLVSDRDQWHQFLLDG